MGIISKQTIDDIRSRSDIVDIIGSYLNLKKTGSSFMTLCPFHKEKTPSFHVNPQRQIFHCFGCGAGGDVFRFIMMQENVDFVGAVRLLAEKVGVKIAFDDYDEDTATARKDILYSILSEISAFYQRCLKSMKEASIARDYLAERKISPKLIEEFCIGYAPDRWNTLEEWAKRKKYNMEDIEEAGLIVRKNDTSKNEWYDRFRGRLMFPIKDEQGRVIAFSGRILKTDDKQTAKYVNSPETPVFRKSKVLYALDRARKKIVETREAILCEGQIDVIRCHEAGFSNAVASQGTAFTEEHARIIRRYADNVVIIFDSDDAGKDAAIKTAGIFLEAGMMARVGSIPVGDDPDSFILKQGAEKFNAIIQEASSPVRFHFNTIKEKTDITSKIGLDRAAHEILLTVSKASDPIQRSILLDEASLLLNLSPSSLQEGLTRLLRRAYKEIVKHKEEKREEKKTQEIPGEEFELCVHIAKSLESEEIMRLIETYLPLEKISSEYARIFVNAAIYAAKTKNNIQDVIRERHNLSESLDAFVAKVMISPEKLAGKEVTSLTAIKDLIMLLWRRAFERERFSLPESEHLRYAQLTYHINTLKSRKWEDAAAIIESESL